MAKHEYIYIGGQPFTYEEYEYLLNSFKAGFSMSSLSIEKAFAEQEDYEYRLRQYWDEESNKRYQDLSLSEKKQVKDVLHQIIVFMGSKVGIFTDTLTDNQKQIDRLYYEYFNYFEPYIYHFIKFDELGNFDKRATYHNLNNLFQILPYLKQASDKAYGMKMDNLNAFDYAMSLDTITINDVIEINKRVNQSDLDKVDGFKTTNNDILSATFTPVDKENVPTEMQKLFADYKNDFGLEILDPYEDNISSQEHLRRCYEIFKKEAIFHIRFERIHPFNDGNGRTGRIIMNQHLLKAGLAPVIIPGIMSDDYKRYIDSVDIDGFAKYLFGNSSQQLTNWTSLVTAGLRVNKNNMNPKNEKLAEMGTNNKKKKIKSLNLLLF